MSDAKVVSTLLYVYTHSDLKKRRLSLTTKTLVINFVALSYSLFVMNIYDRVLPASSLSTLLGLTFVTLLVLVGMGFLEESRQLEANQAAEKFSETLFFDTLTGVYNFNKTRKIGHYAVNNVDNIRSSLSAGVITTLFDLPFLLLIYFILFLIDIRLFSIVLLLSVFIIIINLYIDKRRELAQEDLTLRNKKYLRFLEDLVSNVDIHTVNGSFDACYKRLSSLRIESREQDVVNREIAAKSSALNKAISQIMQTLIFASAAYLVLEKILTPGALFAVTIISARAIAPIQGMVSTFRMIKQIHGNLNEILKYLKFKNLKVPSLNHDLNSDTLNVEKLTYSLPKDLGGRLIIKPFSIRFLSGKCYVISGPNGSGKTTLLKILAGATAPTGGEVSIDSVNITKLPENIKRKTFAYCDSGSSFTLGTIKDNISSFDNPVDDRIVSLMKDLEIYDQVMMLQGKLNEIITSNSGNISSGVAQRISLCRALYHKPKIIFLDEIFGNQDKQSSECIVKVLNEFVTNGGMVFLVAHALPKGLLIGSVLRLENQRISINEQFS